VPIPLSESGSREPNAARAEEGRTDRVQCPNCCRLAPVTNRSMGLLFYRCELCETVGAVPDPEPPDDSA